MNWPSFRQRSNEISSLSHAEAFIRTEWLPWDKIYRLVNF